ncbi:hypothetical protein R1flu_008721 [Riccia fluitans]|uniref:Magnesium transporter n=1 Tax=Riccia fluitans TaxID=41844 RepID=A0ABD1YCI5_9MARC
MGDLKAPLLPPRLPVLTSPRNEGAPRPGGVQGSDVLLLKKRGKGIRSWIRVDTLGNSQVLEVDKATIMRRCNLPARDLRLLDPHFVYPATILGREKTIVLNLEHIRCIITAEEVLLLNSVDKYVLQYVAELRRRLKTSNQSDMSGFKWRPPGGQTQLQQEFGLADSFWEAPNPQEIRQVVVSDQDLMFSGSAADDLPFEFRALEVALEAACSYLDSQASELELEAYPVLDELTSKVSTLNLERVRRLKSRLVILTRRVQKVRDEIEQLMDDDGDMAEMYLTQKMNEEVPVFAYSESSARSRSSLGFVAAVGVAQSVSAPVSPVGSLTGPSQLEKQLSFARSFNRHEAMSRTSRSSKSDEEDVEELEMLLEAYFVGIDGTLNKLTSLKEYIDDTEDFVNIQLDNVRNQLIQFELILTVATFVVAIWGVVAGVFGMNIPVWLYEEPSAFRWVLTISAAVGLLIFCSFLWFFKRMHLLP